jgi:hypothetical protein
MTAVARNGRPRVRPQATGNGLDSRSESGQEERARDVSLKLWNELIIKKARLEND